MRFPHTGERDAIQFLRTVRRAQAGMQEEEDTGDDEVRPRLKVPTGAQSDDHEEL
jgi:hypothetical protein